MSKVILSAVILMLFPATGISQIEENQVMQNIVDQYETVGRNMAPALLAAVQRTFWLLATIELTVSLMFEALKQSGAAGFATTIIHRILFISFFSYLMTNGFDFAEAILNTFLYLGESVANQTILTPDDIFDTGLKLAKTITADTSWWEISKIGYFLLALIVLYCFASMAGYMVLALIEYYVVAFAGVFLLGFGGSSYTKDYALMYFKAVMMVGLKIFILMILSSIGISIVHSYVADLEAGNGQYLALAGAVIALAIMIANAPNLLASFVGGVSHAGAGSMTQAASLAAGAASQAGSATKGAAGMLAAGYQATRAGISQPGNSVVNAGKTFAGAFTNDIKNINSGGGSKFPGSTRGGRMAASIKSNQSPSISKGK